MIDRWITLPHLRVFELIIQQAQTLHVSCQIYSTCSSLLVAMMSCSRVLWNTSGIAEHELNRSDIHDLKQQPCKSTVFCWWDVQSFSELSELLNVFQCFSVFSLILKSFPGHCQFHVRQVVISYADASNFPLWFGDVSSFSVVALFHQTVFRTIPQKKYESMDVIYLWISLSHAQKWWQICRLACANLLIGLFTHKVEQSRERRFSSTTQVFSGHFTFFYLFRCIFQVI